MNTRSLGLIGCGGIGSYVARSVAAGAAGPYRLEVCYDLEEVKAESLAQLTGAHPASSLADLLNRKPSLVIEAACAEAVLSTLQPTLRAGADLMVLSSAAFADDEFYNRAAKLARELDRKIYIPSGALGALDVAQAAAQGGRLEVVATTRKPPRALGGVHEVDETDWGDRKEPLEVFRGTARQAARKFPRNVNVLASLSLATVGMDEVRVSVVADPGLDRNTHSIEMRGAFGSASFSVSARPSEDNPKTSMLAAYSVVALLRKLAAPVQLG